MKKLFSVLLIGTFMFSFVTRSFSQAITKSSELTIEQKATIVVNEMKTAASLTDEQATKTTPVVVEFLKQKEIDKAKYAGNVDALATARNTRITNFYTKMKEIVSDDQILKIKDYWANKRKTENDQN